MHALTTARKDLISGLLKLSLMRFLSKMAETYCELAIVLAKYIVYS